VPALLVATFFLGTTRGDMAKLRKGFKIEEEFNRSSSRVSRAQEYEMQEDISTSMQTEMK
jgi:hypothetical protein